MNSCAAAAAATMAAVRLGPTEGVLARGSSNNATSWTPRDMRPEARQGGVAHVHAVDAHAAGRYVVGRGTSATRRRFADPDRRQGRWCCRRHRQVDAFERWRMSR
jgi:hypothetical protein